MNFKNDLERELYLNLYALAYFHPEEGMGDKDAHLAHVRAMEGLEEFRRESSRRERYSMDRLDDAEPSAGMPGLHLYEEEWEGGILAYEPNRRVRVEILNEGTPASLDEALDFYQLLSPDERDPDVNPDWPEGWWAVSDDRGLSAFFEKERDAASWRLFKVNEMCNPPEKT